jgi:hypothetical protein
LAGRRERGGVGGDGGRRGVCLVGDPAEDDFGREYREIIRQIPVKALLGADLDEAEFQAAFQYFYQYVDLSNEQVFLRQIGRISPETWETWREGIEINLRLAAFKKAWEQVKAQAGETFTELQRLERSDFREDPLLWTPAPQLKPAGTRASRAVHADRGELEKAST